MLSAIVLAALAAAGCQTRRIGTRESPSPAPARAAAVEEGVRAFMRTVARDVTQEGPLAWLRYFNAGPAFFMAVNGQMAFPNATVAKEGNASFAATIKQIDLEWGDDLRVDALTPQLAVVATSWHEKRVDRAGRRVEEAGFFTGLAEYQDAHWQFRDAHWSEPVPPSPAH